MKQMDGSGAAGNEPSYVVLPGGGRLHRAWIMLFGCSLFLVATVSLVFSPIGVFYNAVCTDMGFDRSEISVWQQVHFLVAIPCMPLFSKLLEKINARIVLSACVVGCGAAAILMGTYTEAWQWCISGALYGSFGALGTLQLAGPVVIGNWFSKRTGVAMGLYGIVGAVASVIAPPLFEQIIAGIGWRGAYFVQGAAILAIGLAFTVFICRLRPSEVGAVPYGGVPPEPKLSAEERSRVPWRAIMSVPFFMLFVFAGISSLIGSGFDAHIAGHAVAKGYDTFFGSLMTSALFLGSGADKFLMGWLNDKIGVNKVVFLEYALVIAGMLGLAFGTTPAVLLFAAFLFGVQDSFISVSLPLLVRSFFGVGRMSQILGWVSIGSGVFGSFGSRLVGLSYDATGSFDPAFLIGVCLCAIGASCILVANVAKRRRLARGEEAR